MVGGLDVISYVGPHAIHPRLGPGFGIRTFFPLDFDGVEPAALCAALNSTHDHLAPRVGGWVVPDEQLVLQTFVPAGMVDAPYDVTLANVLAYHERMLGPALELWIDLHEAD